MALSSPSRWPARPEALAFPAEGAAEPPELDPPVIPPPGPVAEPDPRHRALYDEMYGRYLALTGAKES